MHRCFLLLLAFIPLATAHTMITLQFNNHTYDVELADSAAARELLRRLPVTLQMTDLNANEKYGDLPESLPTRSEAVGSIHAGDLMLFTPTCLVLFYKSFRTPYHYTRVGRVLHPEKLAADLGRGEVTITLRAR